MFLATKRFLAGFLATMIFHQGVIAALWVTKLIPRAPFAMNPVPPFGVPAVFSLAFWGGVWGIFLLWLLSRVARKYRLLVAILVGALGPSLVAIYIVSPLKGRAPPDSLAFFLVAFLVNAAWGVGTWWLGGLLNAQKR